MMSKRSRKTVAAPAEATPPPRRRRTAEAPPRSVVYAPTGKYAVQSTRSTGFGAVDSMRELAGGITVSRMSVDAILDDDIAELASQSQRFDTDNSIFQGLVSRLVDYIVGDGLTIEPTTGDDKLDAAIKELSDEWWEQPEIRGNCSAREFQRTLTRHMLVDPNVTLIKKRTAEKLLFIGWDRLGGNMPFRALQNGNRLSNGIETNKDGTIVALWIADYDANGTLIGKPSRVPIELCIFWANRRRFDQTCGEPAGQAVFSHLHRLNDILDSEAASWQVLSRLAYAIKKPGAAQNSIFNAQVDDTRNTSNGNASSYVKDMGMAIEVNLEPGEDIIGIKHDGINPQFEQTVKMFLRLIGQAWGLSLEFLLLIWSDTNYSSGRASQRQVERNCGRWLEGLRKILTEVHRWNVSRWQEAGLLPEGRNVAKCRVHRDPYPSLDPQKESAAIREQLATGEIAPSEVSAQAGKDFEDDIARRLADFKRISDVVVNHNAAYPDNPEVHLTIADFTAAKQESVIAGEPFPATAVTQQPAQPDGGSNAAQPV